MPGVIMENGSRNGSHTNHERDQPPNGANGSNYVPEKGMEKGKGRVERQQNVTPVSPTVPNGTNGVFMSNSHVAIPNDLESPIDNLPPEITHIVGHYMPLSKMLSRVAQKTHNNLQRTILELDQMPKPTIVINGHATLTQGDGDKLADDTNKESIDKKLRALKFAQDAHTEMTKALVITNWSRRSEDVSKLIDLKVHLDTQKSHYDYAVHELAEIKRTLGQARLPNPDLKTAVAVLSTGKAPWIPEFGYIQPPLLTAQEILKSLQNLDTLLSIRLNLDEHDKIPYHFQDYSIKNGRVTFKVESEFEVDLTIADEDPTSQFWFIDFRFTFTPTISKIAPNLRSYVESTVNKTLREGGLAGCYKFLHGMVLTHQISEFRRQAVDLSRGKWVETLKIEALNRSLSIQYWLNRYGRKGPKSWIIIGVHSGKAKDRMPHPKDTPRVSLRWFRDGKEITNSNIPLDTAHISTESLLKVVIAKHIDHILSSTLDALMPKPIYAHGDALGLTIITEEPAESCLEVQITTGRKVSIRIEPTTGRFVLSPMTRTNIQHEYRMNEGILNPAERLHPRIDDIRYDTVQELILSHGAVTGWQRCDNPGFGRDDIGKLVPKDTTRILWLKRNEWTKNRYLAVSMGPGGEGWWLVETTDPAPQVIIPRPRKQDIKLFVKVVSFIRVPIKNNSPLPTYNFMTYLHIFTAALMSHHATLKAMHTLRATHMLHESRQTRNTMRLPAILARISDLVQWDNKNTKNLVKLTFQGLEVGPPSPNSTAEGVQSPKPPLNSVVMVTEARINISIPENILKVKERIDQDIAFDPKTRCLALRLRHKIGESIVQPLVKRVTEVICMLEFSKVIEEHGEDLDCVQISLGKIVFAYGPRTNAHSGSMDPEGSLRQYKAVVDFSATENAMSLILEHGNPHLQIADFMSRILNGKEGLRGVATLLPLTLPVLIGLDAVQMAWGSVSKLKGESFVLTRAVDWHLIRYIIYSPSTDSNTLQPSRKVELEIKLRNRGCDPWWHVRRTDHREPLSDDIDTVLKPVWNMVGNGYQGMRTSSVAQAEGVEELLRKVDDAIRTFVVTQKGSLPSTTTTATAPKTKSQIPPQQRQQQPTPNQSQNSQGRPNVNNQFGRREVVEID